MQYLRQSEYGVKFDWGLDGLKSLSSENEIMVIVDVLSFTTCVSIAIDQNAIVYPYRFKDESAEQFSASIGAMLARSRSERSKFSLSPSSMLSLDSGERVVLPSPNGSALSLEAIGKYIIAGCLRNFEAVADFVNHANMNVSIIAAGEKWPNGNIRYSIEDYLGAGAILSRIKGKMSPEAEMAADAFEKNSESIQTKIENSISGKELKEWGYQTDVDLACEIGNSKIAPILKGDKYMRPE